jgi:hypothetical protein
MNKGQLRTHFKALLNRSDCGDALADTFIDQSIGRIQRTIRIPSMERQQAYSISGLTPQESIVLPSDFLEIIDIYYDNRSLSRLPIRSILEIKQGQEVGAPRFFAREQGSLLLYPRPLSGVVYINYYGQFEDLTVDTSTNDITSIAADAVTYGALAYASDYFLDERGGLFEQKFGTFLSEIQGQANDAETSGTVQSISPASYF